MCFFVFVNDTATPEIYTLSLHDALPIWSVDQATSWNGPPAGTPAEGRRGDRKSTRLNSSHTIISYAVFCLKKKTFLAEDIAALMRRNVTNPQTGWQALSEQFPKVHFTVDWFFFNEAAATKFYPLPLPGVLPI